MASSVHEPPASGVLTKWGADWPKSVVRIHAWPSASRTSVASDPWRPDGCGSTRPHDRPASVESTICSGHGADVESHVLTTAHTLSPSGSRATTWTHAAGQPVGRAHEVPPSWVTHRP